MKEQIIQQLETLKSFLQNIKAVGLNPYSKGIDAIKLIDDVVNYADDMKKLIEEFKEEAAPEVEETEKAE